MAAIAHNPSFAKKVGVPQSVGKDFNEADKGRKFGKGGVTQQRINKQDTKHGKLDLPVANLNRMAGMKGGGSVKKFAGGGELESLDTSQTFKDAFREARKEGVGTFTWHGKKWSTALEAPKAKAAAPSGSIKATPSGETLGGAQTGRTFNRRMQPDVATQSPASKPRADYEDTAVPYKTLSERSKVAPSRLQSAITSMREGSDTPTPTSGSSMKDEGIPMKKGGNVKESKAMAAKEMMFMKKKGAPASMMKHEKAEAGMKKGGMAKFAKGGGIESHGKTKGTIIKMATGGSVSSASRRADGIAQRGKTRC